MAKMKTTSTTATKAAAETRLDRAAKQRLFYMGSRGPPACLETQHIVLGVSGNVYTVTFDGGKPNCNCMDHRIRKKNCKHILFVLLRVLKFDMPRLEALDARRLTHAELDQAAARSQSKIATAFEAPADAIKQLQAMSKTNLKVPSAAGGEGAGSNSAEEVLPEDAKKVARRNPEEDQECPICFEELRDPARTLVFCEYSCGQPLHLDCFQTWETSKKNEGEDVSCVYCRSNWCPEKSKPEKRSKAPLLGPGRTLINIQVPESPATTTEAPAETPIEAPAEAQGQAPVVPVKVNANNTKGKGKGKASATEPPAVEAAAETRTEPPKGRSRGKRRKELKSSVPHPEVSDPKQPAAEQNQPVPDSNQATLDIHPEPPTKRRRNAKKPYPGTTAEIQGTRRSTRLAQKA